jgi:hypothetical protein
MNNLVKLNSNKFDMAKLTRITFYGKKDYEQINHDKIKMNEVIIAKIKVVKYLWQN